MEKLNWINIQEQSDKILSCGLYKLKTQLFCDVADVNEKGAGNYLISIDNTPYYIGEGKELNKRLNQQYRPTTSTFYKNYLKLTSALDKKTYPIDNFELQFMSTKIGRKEIEEFGIVNLPTELNKFQLGKRKKYKIANQNGLWNSIQPHFAELLEEGANDIFKSNFIEWFDIPITNMAGVYLVKNKSNDLIYIGESSNVGDRIRTHSGHTYFSALRRHIGTDILKFELQGKRYFSDDEDKKVTEFLKTCRAIVFPVAFGRYELEEFLIKTHKPLLNRKDNISNTKQ